MLLPCSLQLDLTGQKVIFGITPQLLLLLACSQTCATPCPTCTRKTAGGGPSQSKGISWANVMHSHPYCQPAQVPQDKKSRQGSPCNALRCISLIREWQPGALNSCAQTQRTLKASSSHSLHRGCEPPASHIPQIPSPQGDFMHCPQPPTHPQTVNTLKIPPLSCDAECKFQLVHLQRICNRFLSAL